MELKKLGVKAVHPCAYRWNGFEDKGEITGVYNVKPMIVQNLEYVTKLRIPMEM